jgi:molecular chaperone HscB
MSGACPSCGAELETPLGCARCGGVFTPEPAPSPFEALGLAVTFEVDPKELRRRLLRASRVVHPDYHGSSTPEVRARAERASALLNEAHELLADPARRADWIVRSLGGPTESEQREMPRAFLMEVLEWNEALEAARDAQPGSPARAALATLEADLRSQKLAVLTALARLFTPLPERGSKSLSEARAQLNALRYLETTLTQIEALRLEASSPS